MTELAGIHDPSGRADAERLRRALPDAEVVEAGALALAAPSPGWAGPICAAHAGRVSPPREPRALAAGYARHRERMLDHLRGPFALVVWDRDAQRGLLAQDQLGGRSLFTFRDGRRLLFATEVRVLLALLDRTPPPDELALAFHLVDHSVPEGRMLYAGVRRLGGGRHVLLGASGQVEGRHWAPRYAPPLRAPRAELAERLRAELERAVGEAAASGGSGEPALLLSGGLDSSVVAALTGRVGAVSATFPAEPELDELPWARQVADHLGLRLVTARVEDPRPLATAAAYVAEWGLPLSVPGLVIERPMVTAADELGARVLLDGQGGDELFGAASFHLADLVLHGRPDQAWRVAHRNPWLGPAPPRRHVWQVFASTGLRGALPHALHERIRRARPVERYAPPWLHPRLAAAYREADDPWRWKRLDGPRGWAWLADALTRGRERADIADYARRRAAPLQARSPLLDLGLVELALSLPPETNFDPITSRPLVREALAGALPPPVLQRRDKRDYASFYHRALLAELADLRSMFNRDARVGAYVDIPRFRASHLDNPPAVGDPGWRAWAVHVWNVATAEQWLQRNVPEH